MTTHEGRGLRILAVCQLVALGGAALALWLTIAFPGLGASQLGRGFLYIPPQAYVVVLLVPVTLLFAFATTLEGLSRSLRARQPLWIGVFAVTILLLLTPAGLICAFFVSFGRTVGQAASVPQTASDWWLLAGASASVLVLTAVCALVYASRARP